MRFPLFFYLIPKVVPQHYQESEERCVFFGFICHTANAAGTCLNIPAVQFRFQNLTAVACTPVGCGIIFSICIYMFMAVSGTKLIITVGAVQSFPFGCILIGNVRYQFGFSETRSTFYPVAGILKGINMPYII